MDKTIWTAGFETPPGNPLPYHETSGSADYVLGFMASVIPQGWTLTTLTFNYEE